MPDSRGAFHLSDLGSDFHRHTLVVDFTQTISGQITVCTGGVNSALHGRLREKARAGLLCCCTHRG